jgi:hypothetical protein
MRYLLTHPDFPRQLGQNGHGHVKEDFPDDNQCPAMATAISYLARWRD